MEKWKVILSSSRFRVAVANILFLVLNDKLGLGIPMEILGLITATAIVWIMGRTFKDDGDNKALTVKKAVDILKEAEDKADSMNVPDGTGG